MTERLKVPRSETVAFRVTEEEKALLRAAQERLGHRSIDGLLRELVIEQVRQLVRSMLADGPNAA